MCVHPKKKLVWWIFLPVVFLYVSQPSDPRKENLNIFMLFIWFYMKSFNPSAIIFCFIITAKYCMHLPMYILYGATTAETQAKKNSVFLS